MAPLKNTSTENLCRIRNFVLRILKVFSWGAQVYAPHDSDFLPSLNVGIRIQMIGSNKSFLLLHVLTISVSLLCKFSTYDRQICSCSYFLISLCILLFRVGLETKRARERWRSLTEGPWDDDLRFHFSYGTSHVSILHVTDV